MNEPSINRREAVLRIGGTAFGSIAFPTLIGCRNAPQADRERRESLSSREPQAARSADQVRFESWVATLRREGLGASTVPFTAAAIRAGELALGTPYEAFTLEQYIHAGGSPVRAEPLTLSLTRFDCVSLIESCLAIARVARAQENSPRWEAFAREMERMRYRGGERGGYSSRLHYFSEWLTDNESRGLVQLLGRDLGAVEDDRPLRFMSSHPDSYPALAYPQVRAEVEAMERALDRRSRWVIPTHRIAEISDVLESGDILAFATSIEGLDVTHAAFAYRDQDGAARVLHAPLSGGVVEITRSTIPEYVAAIRQATGILVARPLQGPPE
jgi:hypothetical protein